MASKVTASKVTASDTTDGSVTESKAMRVGRGEGRRVGEKREVGRWGGCATGCVDSICKFRYRVELKSDDVLWGGTISVAKEGLGTILWIGQRGQSVMVRGECRFAEDGGSVEGAARGGGRIVRESET